VNDAADSTTRRQSARRASEGAVDHQRLGDCHNRRALDDQRLRLDEAEHQIGIRQA
jgi:hypothetical protein